MNIDGKKENSFYNLICFIVLFITAVLSLVGGFFDGLLGAILRTVSEGFILLILSISGYKFVSKKGKVWKIIYWISFAVYLASIVFIWIHYIQSIR